MLNRRLIWVLVNPLLNMVKNETYLGFFNFLKRPRVRVDITAQVLWAQRKECKKMGTRFMKKIIEER